MWDRDVLTANDIIAETSIDLYRWFLKVCDFFFVCMFYRLLLIQLAVHCMYDRARRGTVTLSYIRAINSPQVDFTSAWRTANRVRL